MSSFNPRHPGWRAGYVAGIDLYVDPTFLILIGWVAVVSYVGRGLAADAVKGVVYVLALFSLVVLHELGHALVARRFGVRTRDITLLPIGGVASLEKMPARPWQELLVALAGPAVNLVLAAMLVGVMLAKGEPLLPDEVGVVGGTLLANLLFINLSLAAFNLLPAFPMDGGRAVRALLAMKLPSLRATQIAARLGQATALLLGFGGLILNPWLILIAVFVWVGAEAELRAATVKARVEGHTVGEVMVKSFEVVAPDEKLAQVAQRAERGFQHDFPVVRGERVVGVLGRNDLMRGLAFFGSDGFASRATRATISISPNDTIETALARMQQCGTRLLPVTDGAAVVGLITLDQIDLVAAPRANRAAKAPSSAVAMRGR